jgi:hypothetical protein
VLQPDVVRSAAGATLTRLPDGSVLAGGPNPPVDGYTVEAVTTLAGITGLRLEALTDPSLPHDGPGRCPGDGNFHLEAIRLHTVPGRSAPVPVHLTQARADYSDPGNGFRDVSGAIDLDPATLWSTGPRAGRPHWAIFQAARPIGDGRGLRLRVDLDCGLAKYPYHALGRFRLAVTNQPVPFFEPSVTRIKADPVRNGLTRLGAGYFLLGDWAAAASILERAAMRPGSTALDGFLLALARHHLGRHAEARSDCDRAVERLRANAPGDETRDVALEALATIRDLSGGDAELLLLDTVFPADPFAH